MDGIQVRIYSAESTLADYFKYRNKIGIDVCVEALNLYRRRGRMKLDRLEALRQTVPRRTGDEAIWRPSCDR